MQEYLEAIRHQVCSVCIDGLFDGKGQFVQCGLPADRTCPIEVYLPEVIELVQAIESPLMEPYFEVLREKICNECLQAEDGVCELRLKADCALDRYFILVVGAIEEVESQLVN